MPRRQLHLPADAHLQPAQPQQHAFIDSTDRRIAEITCMLSSFSGLIARHEDANGSKALKMCWPSQKDYFGTAAAILSAFESKAIICDGSHSDMRRDVR